MRLEGFLCVSQHDLERTLVIHLPSLCDNSLDQLKPYHIHWLRQ